MNEDPNDGADDRPRFFKNINGWVGGITGIVLALAGLRAAYQQLMPVAPVLAAPEAQETATPVDTADENTAADNSATDETTATALPTSYTGVDLTLEWTGGVWVETTGGEVSRYQQLSRDDQMTHAIDQARHLYLRWPTGGGMVQKSEDNEVTWTDYYSIDVPAEEQPV